MNLINWNDNLVTGIETVDLQHRALLDLINSVSPALASAGCGKVQEIWPLCEQLTAYAAMHFGVEDDLMVTYQVDSRVLVHHREAHAEFVLKVKSFEARAMRGAEITGSEILSFLAGWLIGHILGEDQTLSRQIRAIASGLSPDRAYREAGGYRTAPSETALTEILTSLYMQLIRESRQCRQGEPAG